LDRDGASIRAFIIDAGALEQGACSRDLAALEISLVLHEDYGASEGLFEVPAAIAAFDGTASDALTDINDDTPETIRNVLTFVAALRREALLECKPETYSVLLMDQVLIQLGGLAFGTSQNRIRRPIDAVWLFRLLSKWLAKNGLISAAD
jgi:hypothetical protein